MATIRSLDIALNVDASRTDKQLRKARGDIKKFSREVGKTLRGLAKAGGAAAAGMGAAFVVAARQSAVAADQIAKNARSMGVSAVAYQRLTFAGEQLGLTQEILLQAVAKTTQSLYEARRGSATYVDALGEIDLTVRDLAGLSPDRIFAAIVDALADVPDTATRTAVAMLLLGEQARIMGSLFEGGSGELARLGDQLERVGGVIDGDLETFEELNDQFNLLSRTVKAQFTKALIELAQEFGVVGESADDAIKLLGEKLRAGIVGLGKAVKSVSEFLDDHKELILAVGVAWAGLKVASFAAQFVGLGKAIGGAAAAMLGLNVATAAGPIGALLGLTALAGGVVAYAVATDNDATGPGAAIAVAVDALKRLGVLPERERIPTRPTHLFGGEDARPAPEGAGGAESTRMDAHLQGILDRLARLPPLPDLDAILAGSLDATRAGRILDEWQGRGQARLVPEVSDLVSDAAQRKAQRETEAAEQALRDAAEQAKFEAFGTSVVQDLQSGLQGAIASGSFKGFLRNFASNVLGSISRTLLQESTAALGKSIGGFVRNLFSGGFGGASHSGSFGRGRSSDEVLKLVTADQSILTPRQLEAVFASGRESAEPSISVTITGVDYGADFRSRLLRSGAEVADLIAAERREGARV